MQGTRVKSYASQKLLASTDVEVYSAEKRNKQQKATKEDPNQRRKTNDGRLDLNRARYDVRKLGINAMDGAAKDDAGVQLLIQLGAKPPKKKIDNIKEYKAKRLQEKSQNASVKQSLPTSSFHNVKSARRTSDKNRKRRSRKNRQQRQ